MLKTLAGLLVLASSVAFADGIKNADNNEYRLTITEGRASRSVLVEPSSELLKGCKAYPCSIENKETADRVTVTCREESVEIKGGRFEVKLGDSGPAPAPAPAKKRR